MFPQYIPFPVQQQPCGEQPAPQLANKFVKVKYTDTTPDSTWGPFTRAAAESVATQLAGSPQVVHSVTITEGN